MKNNRRLFLFVTLLVVLLSAACGPVVTATPTPFPPTAVPSETEVPEPTATVEPTATHEMPDATATGDTPTPTQAGVATTIPVRLVCWFCVQQVPHALFIVPQSATVEVPASSSGIECNSVETVGNDQIVLCQGPSGTGMVSFDVNVCSNGTCTERQVTAVDCSLVPTETPTPTSTVTATVTGTGTAGAVTSTPGAVITATATPAVSVPTVTVTLAVPVTTATPTP